MFKKIFSLFVLITPFLLKADVKSKDASHSLVYHQYHNRMSVFTPTHILYERIRPNALYVGVEYYETYVDIESEKRIIKRNTHFSEFEYRMGYHFLLNGRDHLIPILGVGFFNSEKYDKWFHNPHHGVPLTGYVTGGFMYNHEFNSIFNLGVNFKPFVGYADSNENFIGKQAIGGFDISLPITFRFGSNRHWDLRLEPFSVFMFSSDSWINAIGQRSTLGYRF